MTNSKCSSKVRQKPLLGYLGQQTEDGKEGKRLWKIFEFDERQNRTAREGRICMGKTKRPGSLGREISRTQRV